MKKIFSFYLLVLYQISFACVGGGYIQVFPSAKNDNQELWALKLELSRDGRGTHFTYKSSLIKFNTSLKQMDSIGLSKGEYFYDKAEKQSLKQCEFLADSLYMLAVNQLKENKPNLTFLTVKYSCNEGSGKIKLNYEEVLERNEHDSTEIVTVSQLEGLKVFGKDWHINQLHKYMSSNESNMLGLSWKQTPVQGIKVYQSKTADYVVLHVNLMAHANPDAIQNKFKAHSSAYWQQQMYQPIGWHHSGMEVLLKLDIK